MSKKMAWAIKTKKDNFVNRLPEFHWEAERTMLFRTQRDAERWLKGQPYWEGRAEPCRVKVTIEEVIQ
jgi:hypothetical protein